MINKIEVSLELHKDQPTKACLTPIYLRVSINDIETTEINTGIVIKATQWNSQAQCIRGRSEITKLQNIQLLKIKSEVLTNLITNQFSNQPTDNKTNYNISTEQKKERFSVVLESFMEQVKKRSGEGLKITTDTYKNKVNMSVVLSNFISGNNDMTINEINPRWAKRFFDWLLFEKNYSPSYVCNIRVFLKELTKYCFDKELLDDDPLHNLNYRIKQNKKEIVYSDLEQINIIKNFKWKHPNWIKAADLYIFSCYTGLCYSDAMKFDPNLDILTDADGLKWISMSRIKSKVNFKTPLLPEAVAVLSKNNNALPKMTLVNYNKVLRRMSAEIHLPIVLSSHKARKSFAMLITDEYNMPIEAAALMMGHTDTRTTASHYVKINRRKQSEAFGKELNRLVTN